ncbi:MAG: GTP 3',8-cyclase MoaA, partial [Betaproteobacteria bacterium]|nr:GTP 3',8-cyclase MoaA [Betaproteobacteria bacterium]
ATEGWDLKTLLRNGASDELLRGSIAALWEQRDDRYSALRTEATDALRKRRKIEMSYIGG